MKKQKGITLIALVVTIVVLLILAGIALNLVLGDNGIITRSKEAKVTQEDAAEKEKIEMEVLALCIDDGTNEFDVSKLGDKVTIDGKEYKVVEGEVENGQNYEITKDENGEFVIIVNKNASKILLNTPYYGEGLNIDENMYFIFLSDNKGKMCFVGSSEQEQISYSETESQVIIYDSEGEVFLTLFVEEIENNNSNNILISEEENMILATSLDGLQLVNKRYENGNKYIELSTSGVYETYEENSSGSGTYVMYKNKLYTGDPKNIIQTTDDWTTVTYQGLIYMLAE